MWVDSAVVIVRAALRLSKYLLLQKVLEPWKIAILLKKCYRPDLKCPPQLVLTPWFVAEVSVR